MKRRPSGLVLAAVFSTMMQFDRWVLVGGSNSAYQDYLDLESIKRSGDKATLWTRRDFVKQQRTVWHEIEVDCTSKSDTILAYIEDDSGSISHNVTRPHRGSTAIPPGSVEENIYQLVCHALRKRPTIDPGALRP
jgi:hypothetical protein